MSGRSPLDGLRVVSLAEQYPGPFATLVLADLGADVVLVERPAGGDPARQVPDFFESINRNKRSVVLDLKTPHGRAGLLELLRGADVLLDGFRPGTLDRLGLGAERLAAANDRLVRVSISGYGQDGPYRDRPGHDVNYQGMAGLLHAMAESGEPGQPPSTIWGDICASLFAVIAVLAGLRQHDRDGVGANVEVSMSDVLVSVLTAYLVPPLNGGGTGGWPYEPGYGVFRTSDGRLLTLGVAHEHSFWTALCGVLGLGQESAALSSAERHERAAELREQIAAVVSGRPYEAWEPLLEAAGVPFGPVNALNDVADDPHVAARGLLVTLPAEDGRPERRHLRQPLRFDGVGWGPRRHAPRLGEHNEDLVRSAAPRQ